ncbi:VWA domain-containing protein [Halieaceae bacterium IMCC14734]|uniref:VWA domain-containing protein n=1 Tax=Candidatus Litorirhabdus singularis TaxID=2518993 RepID=A0ABT3TGH1_9GAMM|nr:VWA domain-containing protein [Candidatus Litorirhabdus singularis]MCX2981124.1 VWA domain-containing protein [Candidatus Litorirhabdus singularis]
MYKHLLIVTAILALNPGCAREQFDDTSKHAEATEAAATTGQVSPPRLLPAPATEYHEVASAADQAAVSFTVGYAPVMKARMATSANLADSGGHGFWQQQDTENYLAFSDNLIQSVVTHPVSTFSVDVDTAAYSNVRRMLVREGRLPPAAAVKAEEFINYFDYGYDAPRSGDAPFSIQTGLAQAPWNAKTQLLRIGLQGYEQIQAERPAANLVFLIDVSGSMQAPFKLGLVKSSLRLLVNQLRAQDRIALVVYAGAAGLVLESTPGDQRATIMAAIDGLEAGGSTNGEAGIRLAYDVAAQHLIAEGINRVLIASDGDLNVGTTNIEALQELVSREKQRGIALSTLGFGSGNYNYALMEQIADKGDGNAAYIDNLKEAHKVLVRELGSTLQTIASDVKIQVEFNPALVSEYRLIGYENRLLAREDFSNDKVDAGDIGAGHTVTALYEVVMKGSGGERLEQLRYGAPDSATEAAEFSGELAFVRLRYKNPGEQDSRELMRVIETSEAGGSMAEMDDDYRFAVAVAGFAQLLRGGKYTGDWNYNSLLTLLDDLRGSDPYGYRGEMKALVELSRDLSGTNIL